jgi:hypothetical protein
MHGPFAYSLPFQRGVVVLTGPELYGKPFLLDTNKTGSVCNSRCGDRLHFDDFSARMEPNHILGAARPQLQKLLCSLNFSI